MLPTICGRDFDACRCLTHQNKGSALQNKVPALRDVAIAVYYHHIIIVQSPLLLSSLPCCSVSLSPSSLFLCISLQISRP